MSAIKDINNTVFIFHPTDGQKIINPEEALCYYEQGWLDHPATEKDIELFAESLKKQMKENEKKQTKKEEKQHETQNTK